MHSRTRVLDLFAGLEGWSEPWREAGHDVFSVDIDEEFDVDLHANIMDLYPSDLPWKPDVVLASPPCEAFSVLTIGKNWTKPTDDPPNAPKTEQAHNAEELVFETLRLIRWLDPAVWVMENPRAKLRVLPVMEGIPRCTVWYCRYGMPYAKPTDLWPIEEMAA